VADGQTTILDDVATNTSGGLIVGTNGSFTLLTLTDGATLTNTGGYSIIGESASAKTNQVVVTGAGTVWDSKGLLDIGQNGSANELDILNGGLVLAAGYVGGTAASSNNLVLVSGAGSTWTNASSLVVGNGGSHNTLILTNGGAVFSGQSGVGENAFAVSSNAAVITGPGSSWTSGYFYLGYISAGHNQLLINNGGSLSSSSTLDIGVYDSSNLLTVADSGSSAQCQTFRVGYASTANQCVVSNGATLAVNSSGQATTIEGTFTLVTVTGAGSVWTNAGDLDFGQSSNVLAITSGGTMVDNNGYIEISGGKTNLVTVAGTNSLWNNLADLHIADSRAQLLITNGGTVADSNGYLGDIAGNTNNLVLVSGPGSL